MTRDTASNFEFPGLSLLLVCSSPLFALDSCSSFWPCPHGRRHSFAFAFTAFGCSALSDDASFLWDFRVSTSASSDLSPHVAMRFSTILALLGGTEAAIQGFNYASTHSDGSPMTQSDFESVFTRAQNLQGTSGWSSARLYTMIQGGSTDTPISAIPAAIDTKTSLLLGLWASAGQASFSNELTALTSAINQYGTAFTDLIAGISVGSEDLYRITPTGIANQAGIGSSPDTLVSYINQVRSAIAGTSASGSSIGHVDTWTAWVNGSNTAVVTAVDWLGFDGYPYFQTVNSNGIDNAQNLFQESYDATVGAAQGKPVWVTETGWPVSGPVSNLAVASVENAQTYWDEVGCSLFGKTNTWWYTIQDANPGTPSPSFGIIGSDLSSAPLYNLTCAGISTTTASASSATSLVASATMPTSAAVSSTVAITNTPGPEASGSATASGIGSSTPSTATGSPAGSGAGSSSPPSATGASPAGSSESTITTRLTTTIKVTTCPMTCETTLATLTKSAVGSGPAVTPSASSAAPGSGAMSPASPSGSACPANLNGAYEYPHLIVSVDSANPSKAYGTSYNGTITPTISSIFDFDIPASDAGKTCSLVFLFPEESALETSAYTFNGKGGISVSKLPEPATEQTTYNSISSAAAHPAGSIPSLQPGNSYVVSSYECAAGQRVAFEFSSTGGLDLDFFEDYNPSPLGAYITVC